LPYDEGNNMTGGAWPSMRVHLVALAVAGAVAAAIGPARVHAQQPPEERAAPHRGASYAAPEHTHPHRRGPQQLEPLEHGGAADHASSAQLMRAAVPPDLEERRRDGHMTPEERRLLRQHIEDAVRELYKR
jgi:hypothetical protein